VKNKLYRQYGLLLEDILNYFGIQNRRSLAKKELHVALKQLNGINSLRDLTESEMWLFILQIHVTFASELGIMLKKPGEYEDTREMDMKEFLNLIK